MQAQAQMDGYVAAFVIDTRFGPTSLICVRWNCICCPGRIEQVRVHIDYPWLRAVVVSGATASRRA
jgi:hypothetical protein